MSLKKKSIALILSAIIGAGYALYITTYFGGTIFKSESAAAAAGVSIAAALVTPHMLCTVVAAIFNVIACFNNNSAFALTGAILYCCAAVLFLFYALFVVPSIILSFVGYARLKKLRKAALVSDKTSC